MSKVTRPILDGLSPQLRPKLLGLTLRLMEESKGKPIRKEIVRVGFYLEKGEFSGS
jgi:hypothetical protein